MSQQSHVHCYKPFQKKNRHDLMSMPLSLWNQLQLLSTSDIIVQRHLSAAMFWVHYCDLPYLFSVYYSSQPHLCTCVSCACITSVVLFIVLHSPVAVTRIYFREVLGDDTVTARPEGPMRLRRGGVLEEGAPPSHQLGFSGALYRGYPMVTFQNFVIC